MEKEPAGGVREESLTGEGDKAAPRIAGAQVKHRGLRGSFGEDTVVADRPTTQSNQHCCLSKNSGQATNLARGRPAFQSSTYPDVISGIAHKAVDGNCDGNFHHASCTHTDQETEPWWYVDLGEQYAISAVVVKNRGDCCGSRLWGAEVHVGDSTGSSSKFNPVCDSFQDTSDGSLSTIYCNGLIGRYVSIVIRGRADYLHVCEVEVYGTKLEREC
ncbi:fucolectin-like [Tiliqua scincoides]|uniref:fucolectin-like n=1 Tax=Tiliqua scincoides TaxID=71010 RepID=UPI003461CEB2